MTAQRTIRVLVAYPGAVPEERRIPATLEALQALVGGWVEAVALVPKVMLYWNEDGREKKLPPNRKVGETMILGPIVVARHDSNGETVDLTDADVEKARALLG